MEVPFYIPWPIILACTIGGILLTTFANMLPANLQTFFGWTGLVIVVASLLAAIPYALKGSKNSLKALYADSNTTGTWNGGRFVFHTPQHLLTIQAKPDDNGKVVPIKVEEAEPNAFVEFKIEYDGGKATAEIVPHENNAGNFGNVTRATTYAVRLGKDKQIKMVINIPPESDPTIIRVYVLYWEM